ncbi:hypothetical protein [Absidia glauca]|uniref:Uncharacterized protein n=1 Tax=Absidia glauca TaxID=4829 RepID=A0A163M0H1_ABSGL|nr:hypothetical protein [Absidia glauca]
MSSNQRTSRRPIITMEDLARMIRKDRMEIRALRELLETHLERLAPPAASPIYPGPTVNSRINIPEMPGVQKRSTTKGKIVRAIELHLLADAKAGCSEVLLAKIKNGSKMAPDERKAHAVFNLVSLWAKNLADGEIALLGTTPTFPSLDLAKQEEMIANLEASGLRYGIHLARAKDSLIARYLLTSKFATPHDQACKQAKLEAAQSTQAQAVEDLSNNGINGDEGDYFSDGTIDWSADWAAENGRVIPISGTSKAYCCIMRNTQL